MDLLERRYRRLLALYPRAHRAIHEDEMLAVLLGIAAPGQTRPRVSDTADLVRGALLIWLRHLRGALQQEWADALAIVAILAPLMLCLISFPAAGLLLRAVLEPTVSLLTVPLLAGAVVAWPLVLTLALLDQRRLAAIAAWMSTAASSLAFVYQEQEILVLELLAAFALTYSPGTKRGVTLLGRARVLSYAAGVLLVGVFLVERFAEGLAPGWAATPALGCFLVGWFLICRTAFRLRQATNRRVAILLALPVTAVAITQLSLTGAVSHSLSSLGHVLLPLGVLFGLVVVERRAIIH